MTIEQLQADYAALTARVDALEAKLAPVQRQLLGGWRIPIDFARGSFAIDFSTMRMWMTGHAAKNEIWEFNLPARGQGTDVSKWPVVTATKLITRIHPPSSGYTNGLCFWRGKLWVSTRVYYDTSPPNTMTMWASDGEQVTFPLRRQEFSGFVKRGPGLEPYIGCGGYESGQGSALGPTLAKMDGTILINHRNTTAWEGRAPREPNYWPIGHTDKWFALEPRNGEGRWASDKIDGGGLVLPEGICYWPFMGTGEIDYKLQNATFSRTTATYKYTYEKSSFALRGWEPTDLLRVAGQEIDAEGNVYLSEVNKWKRGLYKVCPTISVFGEVAA